MFFCLRSTFSAGWYAFTLSKIIQVFLFTKKQDACEVNRQISPTTVSKHIHSFWWEKFHSTCGICWKVYDICLTKGVAEIALEVSATSIDWLVAGQKPEETRETLTWWKHTGESLYSDLTMSADDGENIVLCAQIGSQILMVFSTRFSPPRPSSGRRPSSAPSLWSPAPPPLDGSGQSWPLPLCLFLSAGRCKNGGQQWTATSRLRHWQTRRETLQRHVLIFTWGVTVTSARCYIHFDQENPSIFY